MDVLPGGAFDEIGRNVLFDLMVSAAKDTPRIESVIGENSGSEVTGLAHLTDGENGTVTVDLIKTNPQLTQGDIDGSRCG